MLETFVCITRHKRGELRKPGVKQTQAPEQSDTTNKCLISFETSWLIKCYLDLRLWSRQDTV
jgi:hypothetical protein